MDSRDVDPSLEAKAETLQGFHDWLDDRFTTVNQSVNRGAASDSEEVLRV